MVKFCTIYNKWLLIDEKKALEIAKRLYSLKKDIKAINKRFREIEFTEEMLKGAKNGNC